MGFRLRSAAQRALRRTFGAAARRFASSDRLMNVFYDLQNENHFAGLAEHEEMLNDRVRVATYREGIRRNVGPGDVVLDLGTGTGLLAFLASRAGASKVYAVEHSDFIDVAREIADHNGFDNIEFVKANSRDFAPPEPVDVVLHEQMGDELFNENMLENLLDLRDRVLRPGGRILPAKFRLFVEPVTLRDDMRVRRFWNIDLPDGIDLSVAETSAVAAKYHSVRSDEFWARAGSIAEFVGTPEPLLEVDVQSLASIDEIPLHHPVARVAGKDTIVDGLCVWFEAEFDSEVTLTTSPLAPVTSWGNRVFRLDREVHAGQRLDYLVSLEDLVDASKWVIQVA